MNETAGTVFVQAAAFGHHDSGSLQAIIRRRCRYQE
jgi:hypothetical protein